MAASYASRVRDALDADDDPSSSEMLERWCTATRARDVPRLLVVAAHPDDDILGLGARLVVAAPRVHVVYVSDGAPVSPAFHAGFESRAAYARAREREAALALHRAGVPSSHVHALGATDQAVAQDLARLTRAIFALAVWLRPEALMTHPYEGGHPDHDATACAVHVARALLRARGHHAPPLLELASYHARGDELVRGTFRADPTRPAVRVPLGDAERRFKLELLSCHATQEAVWRPFPLDAEEFRVAPRYDFRAPPPGPIHYERVGWGITSGEITHHLSRHLRDLGSERPC